VTSRNDALAKIEERYSNAGFSVAGVECPSGVVFQNPFSVQALFVVGTGEELQRSWTELHDELIRAYRSYEGFVDMEWNFYCVFIVLDAGGLDGLPGLRNHIENDTSYSRKFVYMSDEVRLLPPGRVDSGLANATKLAQADPAEQWVSVLGEDLLDKISATPFAKLKGMLGSLVEKEASDVD
jgi:hypothetical protein